MGDPITIALMAAGTGLNVFGNLSGGQSQYDNFMYQSKVAGYNADISAAQGDAEADRSGMKTRATVGAIQSAFGANNVDVNSGSAAKVQDSARILGSLDALTIRSDAARESWGSRSKAKLLEKSANDAREASWLKAASSLISGGSAMSDYGSKKDLLDGASSSTRGYNPASWVTWGS